MTEYSTVKIKKQLYDQLKQESELLTRKRGGKVSIGQVIQYHRNNNNGSNMLEKLQKYFQDFQDTIFLLLKHNNIDEQKIKAVGHQIKIFNGLLFREFSDDDGFLIDYMVVLDFLDGIGDKIAHETDARRAAALQEAEKLLSAKVKEP